jgi:hypothetical protein
LRRIIENSAYPKAGHKAARDYLLADMAEGGVVDQEAKVIRPDALRKWRDK